MTAHRLPRGGPEKFDTSEAMCAHVAQFTDTVVLGFSAGKDALSAWLQCRRFFARVVPFYLEDVPGTPFVEANLRYYEDFFRTPITRYPSPAFFNIVKQGIYQPLHLWRELNAEDVPRPPGNYSHEAIVKDLMRTHRCEGTVVARGEKRNDSLARAIMIKNHGGLSRKRSAMFAVYDWDNDRMEREFRREGVSLASDYRFLARTFEGARAAQLGPMLRRTPRSSRRLLSLMPMAVADLARREFLNREQLETYNHR